VKTVPNRRLRIAAGFGLIPPDTARHIDLGEVGFVGSEDLLAAEAVLPLLLGARDPLSQWTAGLPYRYLACCGSTNDLLKEAGRSSETSLALFGLTSPPGGAALVADEQLKGRGRLDRSWSSEPGKDLTFSVLLRPKGAPDMAHLFSLAAALAVAEVLETIAGLAGRVLVKWPNDVLVDRRKICGILGEGVLLGPSEIGFVVVGIGINVNSDPRPLPPSPSEERGAGVRPEPVSALQCCGRQIPRGVLLAALLARLSDLWGGLDDREEETVARLLAGLRARDALMGREVTVVASNGRGPSLSGRAAGLGSRGELLVDTAVGRRVGVFSGDATLRGL